MNPEEIEEWLLAVRAAGVELLCSLGGDDSAEAWDFMLLWSESLVDAVAMPLLMGF